MILVCYLSLFIIIIIKKSKQWAWMLLKKPLFLLCFIIIKFNYYYYYSKWAECVHATDWFAVLVKAFCYNTISMYHYTIIKFYIRFFKHLWNKQQVHLAFFHRHINCLFLSFELLFNFRIFIRKSMIKLCIFDKWEMSLQK